MDAAGIALLQLEGHDGTVCELVGLEWVVVLRREERAAERAEPVRVAVNHDHIVRLCERPRRERVEPHTRTAPHSLVAMALGHVKEFVVTLASAVRERQRWELVGVAERECVDVATDFLEAREHVDALAWRLEPRGRDHARRINRASQVRRDDDALGERAAEVPQPVRWRRRCGGLFARERDVLGQRVGLAQPAAAQRRVDEERVERGQQQPLARDRTQEAHDHSEPPSAAVEDDVPLGLGVAHEHDALGAGGRGGRVTVAQARDVLVAGEEQVQQPEREELRLVPDVPERVPELAAACAGGAARERQGAHAFLLVLNVFCTAGIGWMSSIEDSMVTSTVANMAEPGNMRPCGCHRGRPCTCEMGRRLALADFACGQCVNCQLNARALLKHRKPVRKCVQYDAFVAEQQLDRLEVAPGCVLRMRKPDWDVDAKSAFYTLMRQLRLALVALHLQSALTVERQKALRKKYNRDLVKAQEALQRVEAARNSPAGGRSRKMTADVTHVDSDVFDSFSKQLIPAETLIPDLLARLENANETIATEERNLQLIEAYVREVAVKKLQSTVREYQRARRWKLVWWRFCEDAQWAAAVVIQSMFRMARCRHVLDFLRELQREKAKLLAAERLCRFFHKLYLARRFQANQKMQEAIVRAREQKHRAAAQLLVIVGKILCRMAIWKWRERQREATAHDERKIRSAAVKIQQHWRGLRERLNYQRIRYRRLLSDPVRALYDRFVCHGDLWRMLFEVDAAFRRYEHREQEEREDAKTFVSELVRDKRDYEDSVMQAWLTASALESPIVRGAQSMVSAFGIDESDPEGFPLAQAVLQSPMAKDLVAMSPNKKKSDVFPDDLPPHALRLATYEGFAVSEIVAVMRGLIAQGKSADDPKLVLKVLKSRAPLTIHPWKVERVVRHEVHNLPVALTVPVKQVGSKVKRVKKKTTTKKSNPAMFLSENMIDNIPGGLKGDVTQLLLVAGLRCYDPDGSSRGMRGEFVFRLEASRDPWRSYIDAPSQLTKIRREQLVQDAIKRPGQILKENRCFTPMDILHNARGIDELVSWGIPRPLVMSMYDVIELLHQQTVNRSERSMKRQMRVSAQFEAFLERQTRRSNRVGDEHALPTLTAKKPADPPELEDIACALERDVLELPMRDGDVSLNQVLFKAHFLLCNAGIHSSNNDTAFLSRDNYKRFLSEIVRFQMIGDGVQVKQLVQKRMEMASDLASECASRLTSFGMTCAHDLKHAIGKGQEMPLQEQLRLILKDLLATIQENESGSVGKLKPDISPSKRKHNGRGPAPLSPLVRQSKITVDKLDDALRDIHIPL